MRKTKISEYVELISLFTSLKQRRRKKKNPPVYLGQLGFSKQGLTQSNYFLAWLSVRFVFDKANSVLVKVTLDLSFRVSLAKKEMPSQGRPNVTDP